MLPKTNRATTKNVEKVFKTGKSIHSPILTFKYLLLGGATNTQISFLAPKPVAKLAVRRNFLRRLGYTALGKHINSFPSGLIGVFIYKKPVEDILIIENEIKNTLSKLN